MPQGQAWLAEHDFVAAKKCPIFNVAGFGLGGYVLPVSCRYGKETN